MLLRLLVISMALIAGSAVAFYLARNTVEVAVLGDSITSQMSPRKATFPPPFNAATYLGNSGDTCSQVVARIGSIPSTTSHVIVQMGTNDLLGLDSEAGIGPGYTSAMASIPSQMKVIVIGILPVDEVQMLASSGPTYPAALNNARIKRMNLAISEICRTRANCTMATGIMAKSAKGKTPDGIHPTAEFDIEITKALVPLLAQ